MDDKEKFQKWKEEQALKEQQQKEKRDRNIRYSLTYGIPAAAIIGLGSWVAVEKSNNNSLEEENMNLRLAKEQKLNQAENKYNQLNVNYNEVVGERNEFENKYNNQTAENQRLLRNFNSLNLSYDRTLAERDSLSGVVADVTSDNDSLILANSGLEKSLSEVRDSLSSEQKLTAQIKEANKNLQMSKEQMYEALLNSTSWGAAIIKNRTFGYVDKKEAEKMRREFLEEYSKEQLKNFNFPTTFRERRYIKNQLPN